MVFQTYPGGIQSGLDYYLSDSGLIVSETTIEQTAFNAEGEILARAFAALSNTRSRSTKR